MLYKTIIISIVVAVSFISSVENASIITCRDDDDFLKEAKNSLGETVAIIVNHLDFNYPKWMEDNFENVVTKILVITLSSNSYGFKHFRKFLRTHSYPTLYVVKKGYRLKEKLVSQLPKYINKMIAAAQNSDSVTVSNRQLADEFEEFILERTAEEQGKARKNAGSTSGRTEGSSNLGGQSDTGLNLNEPASMEDNSFRLFGTNLRTNDSENVHNRELTSGGEITPSSQDFWLFGEPYTPSGGLSKSPSTPTGSNSRKHSISPSAPGDSRKGKRPRSPS